MRCTVIEWVHRFKCEVAVAYAVCRMLLEQRHVVDLCDTSAVAWAAVDTCCKLAWLDVDFCVEAVVPYYSPCRHLTRVCFRSISVHPAYIPTFIAQ